MSTIKIIAALGVLCLPLAALSTPAFAATAHNSQAGANGNTTNDDATLGKKRMMHKMHKKHMMKKM